MKSILKSHLCNGREGKFVLNFRSVAKNWAPGFSVLCWTTLLFHKDTQWLWCVPAWNWKHTDLCACLQQLFTKACLEHMSWAQKQTLWQITSGEEAQEKPSLPSYQAVCPGMSQGPGILSLLPLVGSENILADIWVKLPKYKIQNVPATFIIFILLRDKLAKASVHGEKGL